MQFVRDRKGNPRGVVVATIVDNQIRYGWSYTNTKLGDRFNKHRGLAIAHGRIDNGWSDNVSVPHNVIKSLNHISNRADRYFKIA
jgi:hypothetical protein